MLKLTRKVGESLIIDEGELANTVTLLDVKHDRVKLHIGGSGADPTESVVTLDGVPNRNLWIGVGDGNIAIIKVDRHQVMFGIDAPDDVSIDRTEIRQQKEMNNG